MLDFALDLLLLARPHFIWAQLLERRSCGGPTTLGEAAAPHPSRVLHALHAQAPRPCLAAALAWPLPASRGLPSYHACAADCLPGRGAPTAVRPRGRRVSTFVWPH